MNANTYRQIAIAHRVLANLRSALQADEDPGLPAGLINQVALLQAALPEDGVRDSNGKLLKKGMVVRYQEGWRKVQSIRKGKGLLNLAPIFGGRISAKDVPAQDVFEDHDAWYAEWQQSETYKSM